MDIPILFEDQDIVVINKPAGVVVNNAQTVRGKTIQQWFVQRLGGTVQMDRAEWMNLVPEQFENAYGSPELVFEQRQGIVHRLDKDTSGVLVLAKNPGSLVSLLAQFKQRRTQKKYQCLVHGKFSVSQDRVSLPIARKPGRSLRFSVQPGGREAVTEYRVDEFYEELTIPELKDSQSYQGFSLVTCWPMTGRTHQIRVHLAHLKHPIVGDKLYVGKKRAALDEQWCKRQFLHAHHLSLTHPRSRKVLGFTAPLTDDLLGVLKLLVKAKKPF